MIAEIPESKLEGKCTCGIYCGNTALHMARMTAVLHDALKILL